MPGVVRKTDKSGGHSPSEPTSYSPNVKANGLNVVRVGDSWSNHPHGSSTHSPSSSGGSGKVFVNGKAIVRSGDPLSCGGSASNCSDNVIAGG